jgi:hypothetical protein
MNMARLILLFANVTEFALYLVRLMDTKRFPNFLFGTTAVHPVERPGRFSSSKFYTYPLALAGIALCCPLYPSKRDGVIVYLQSAKATCW